MTDISRDKLTADEIIRKIQAEVRARQQATAVAERGAAADGTMPAPMEPVLYDSEGDIIESRDRYHLHELLGYHDRNFIVNTYRALLKRDPDESGLSRYLDALRNNELTKVEIIGNILRSPEGRNTGVAVQGLWLPYGMQTAFRVPLVGYLLRFVTAILRLPTLVKNLYGLDQHLHAELQRLKQHVNSVSESTGQKINELITVVPEPMDRQAAEFSELKQETRRQLDRMDALKVDHNELRELREQKADRSDLESLRAQKADRSDLKTLWDQKADRSDLQPLWEEKASQSELQTLWDQKVDQHEVQKLWDHKADRTELAAIWTDKVSQAELDRAKKLVGQVTLELHQHKLSILDQERRLRLFLKQALERLPRAMTPEQTEEILKEKDHFLDSLYVSFEDRFRGTRRDIKERLQIYLPHLPDHGAENARVQVLDLGCGRGEWLELIQAEGYAGRGIDCNRIMVEECRRRGLDALQEDLFGYLESLPADQIDAITSFHVVEHLPLADLIRMLDESLRVLKPNGLLILETPNPENLMVGACNFYYDPTHRNPLPPPILKYLVEARGFWDGSILELHPVAAAEREHLGDSEPARLLEKLIYGPRDYAVIARKA